MKNKTKILIILFTTMLIGMGLAAGFIYAVYGKNIKVKQGEKIITIQEGSTYEDVKLLLSEEQLLKSPFTFDLISKLMKYNDNSIKDGKYLVRDGWSNRDLISILRIGRQVPIHVTYNNVRTVEDLTGKIVLN